jgi:hypothetical protein
VSGRTSQTEVEDAIHLGEPDARIERGGARVDRGIQRDPPVDRLAVNLVGVGLDPFMGREADPANANAPKIFAGVDLGGHRNAPERRWGRGLVRMLGDVIDVPLVVKMMQIPHLSLPVVSSLGYGETDFYINGNELEFEHILFESSVGDSAPLQLLGDGRMNLDSYVLDTRFRSRGGWLLVRDLIGGIGDQLYVIKVAGPLSDPEASLVPLPGLSPRSRARDINNEHSTAEARVPADH